MVFMKKSMKYKLIVLLGAVGISCSSILARYTTAPSMIITLYRTVIAALFFMPGAIKSGDDLRSLSIRQILSCFAGGVCFAASCIAYVEAVKTTDLASATFLIDCEILFIAPIMMLVYKEKFSGKCAAGILMTLCGGAVIIISGFLQSGSAVEGNLQALAGAFFLACSTIISRENRKNLSNSTYSMISNAGAAVTLTVAALIIKTPIFGYDPKNFLIAAGFTVLCTFGGHAIFSWAIKFVRASFVSMAKLLEPFIATCFGLILFSEVPSPAVITGGCIAIVGVFIYTKFEEIK